MAGVQACSGPSWGSLSIQSGLTQPSGRRPHPCSRRQLQGVACGGSRSCVIRLLSTAAQSMHARHAAQRSAATSAAHLRRRAAAASSPSAPRSAGGCPRPGPGPAGAGKRRGAQVDGRRSDQSGARTGMHSSRPAPGQLQSDTAQQLSSQRSQTCRPRMTSQATSGCPGSSPWRAEYGKAWWLLCHASPAAWVRRAGQEGAQEARRHQWTAKDESVGERCQLGGQQQWRQQRSLTKREQRQPGAVGGQVAGGVGTAARGGRKEKDGGSGRRAGAG